MTGKKLNKPLYLKFFKFFFIREVGFSLMFWTLLEEIKYKLTIKKDQEYKAAILTSLMLTIVFHPIETLMV